MIKVATVCSGIGSPEQALKNLNIQHEISFACEIDKYARQTYLANFEPKLMLSDMTKEQWIGEEFYSDLFIGGIPCQAFSLAGKRLGELDPRGLLFYDFYRYVKNQQPKVFIIENVKGLLSDNNGTTFQNWVQLLGRSVNTQENMFNHPDTLGYNLHWTVLNSKDFAVPQNRERVFLIGIRSDLPNTFRFPTGERLKLRLKDILEEDVDEKYYLSDKIIEWIKGHREKRNSLNKFPLTPSDVSGCLTARYHKCGAEDMYIEEHTDKLIKVGQLEGFESAGRIYSTEGLSPTITAKQGGGHEPFIVDEVIQLNSSKESGGKQPFQHNIVYADYGLMKTLDTDSGRKSVYTKQTIRRLTPLECMRLQGFLDSFIKPCSDSQTYKQAGNSITVNVIQSVIEKILLQIMPI